MPCYWAPTMCLGLHSSSVNSHKEVTFTSTLQIANWYSKRENKSPTASHQKPAFASPTCNELYFHWQYKCWNWLFLLLKSPVFTPHIPSPLEQEVDSGVTFQSLPKCKNTGVRWHWPRTLRNETVASRDNSLVLGGKQWQTTGLGIILLLSLTEGQRTCL